MAELLKDSPTDAQIEAEFDEMKAAGAFDDIAPARSAAMAEAAARKVAAKLIEDGWDEGIEDATFRVGVCCFGWKWPQ